MPAYSNNAALLEKRLTLVSWFAGVLGYDDNANMLRNLKADEGWGDKYNKVLERWKTEAGGIDGQTLQVLQELDADIRADWDAINLQRAGNISLKYFQYLAALASALFLYRLKEGPNALLEELRQHSEQKYELEKISDIESLYKLAFWMATGSGKTLLMHLHYRQFIRYQQDLFIPDNIILITPNEELSRQHIAEMEMSSISCFRHGDNATLLHAVPHAVRVIEITKLLSEQGKRSKGKGNKGKGGSVHVEEFSGRNLIFVDEGHKGAGGEEWFKVRNILANNGDERGFVFEYSATFGQALSVSLLQKPKPKQESKLREYERAKAYARNILFDYSYRYFHSDGYGKDFSILGIHSDPADTKAEQLLMLGNLLRFFQQQWVYEQNKNELIPYNIEKPLLLLLGGTVTGKKSEEDKRSDIQKILTFLHQVAADKDANRKRWLQNAIENLLNGQFKVFDGEGKDLFAGQFDVLKREFTNTEKLPEALRRLLFYAGAEGALRFSLLKQAKGEAMLRVGENPPFALVYVGEINKLSVMVAQDELVVDSDAIQSSLFSEAHLPTSPLNILIGAKKFMEGWSSWRVSSMGLLDIGKSEGTQIIQLFGRGVRLQGCDFSLKRSTPQERRKMSNAVSECLPLLETLSIFSIRANYMANFKEYLQREGVLETSVIVKIKIDTDLVRGKELQALQFPSAHLFTDVVEFMPIEGVTVKLDYGVRAQSIHSDASGDFASSVGYTDIEGQCFPPEAISLLDFDLLYHRLLDRKYQQKRKNLIIHYDQLKDVLQEHCKIVGSDDIFNIDSAAKLRRLHDIALAALNKYVEKLYYRCQKKWETANMELMPLFNKNYEPVEEMRDNFLDYEIRIPQSKKNPQEQKIQLDAILHLLEKEGILHKFDGPNDGLLRIAFGRHLYTPLLLEEPGITITPPGLVLSEEDFVRKLRDYLDDTKNKQVKDNIFLLRNAGRGKGIGFYEDEGFYPDFILWVKQGNKQRIVLIEPHGMLHAPAYSNDYKAHLWEKLQELTRKLQRQSKDISVDSYIISQTKFEKLKIHYDDGNWDRDKFKAHHILFSEDNNLIEDIINAEQ